MIVRQFISWIKTAPAGERAEATRALARAWLISDLSEDDRAAAEGALLMLLDDPSPLVRRAMAEVFARSQEAPAAIVQALALDQCSVALPILEHSPLLIDADLVDLAAHRLHGEAPQLGHGDRHGHQPYRSETVWRSSEYASLAVS